MKILLLLLTLVLGAGTAHAQSYDYLTLKQANGTETSLNLDNLRITFADGLLVADNGIQSVSIALADMDKMFFALESTGLNTVSSAADATPAFRIENGRLITDAPAGSVSVYGTDGRQVPASGLAPGVYVVKIKGQSFKVLAR